MNRHRGRWFSSGGPEEAGTYNGESLRQLLAFSLEPTPTVKQLERMLATLTVSATVRRCHPQFWAMDEIMRQVLGRPEDAIISLELDDISGLISVAARAFLDRKITAPTLWAVAKLHSAKFDDWLQLDSKQSKSSIPRSLGIECGSRFTVGKINAPALTTSGRTVWASPIRDDSRVLLWMHIAGTGLRRLWPKGRERRARVVFETFLTA